MHGTDLPAPACAQVGSAADVFSLGMVALSLLSGLDVQEVRDKQNPLLLPKAKARLAEFGIPFVSGAGMEAFFTTIEDGYGLNRAVAENMSVAAAQRAAEFASRWAETGGHVNGARGWQGIEEGKVGLEGSGAGKGAPWEGPSLKSQTRSFPGL